MIFFILNIVIFFIIFKRNRNNKFLILVTAVLFLLRYLMVSMVEYGVFFHGIYLVIISTIVSVIYLLGVNITIKVAFINVSSEKRIKYSPIARKCYLGFCIFSNIFMSYFIFIHDKGVLYD